MRGDLEEKKAYKKAWYEKHKDKCKAKFKANHEANRERDNANSREWYQVNKKQALARSKARYLANPGKAQVRKRFLSFGITEKDFNRMTDTQGHVCTICGWVVEDPRGKAKTLHVDHSHTSGQVRALLCEQCNKGLGHFKDSAVLLRKGAAYLEHFQFIEQTEKQA